MKYTKLFLIFMLAILLQNCAVNYKLDGKAFKKANESISIEELKKNLYTIASDSMQGRRTGSDGQKKAANYIANYYKKLGINHPISMNSYYQIVPAEFMNEKMKNGTLPSSENILAFIPGTEKPDEIIVVSAHYDHLGTKNDVVYNGADDDGSGTVSVMQIAKAFQKAKNKKQGPKRSLLFLHVTGEEFGLFGSSYYTQNPVFTMSATEVNLNIDMIGRDDAENRGKDYVYVIGSDMLSSELKGIIEEANKKTNQLELNYKYDDPNDTQRLYYRSDHYNFAKNNVPVAFFFDGIHEDYHESTDDPEKIDYNLLRKRAQLIFAVAWDLANRNDKITADKK